jgi:CheY-like chemotaxis protein
MGDGTRVLLVEDCQETAWAQASLLRLLGHDVYVAHDGPGALEALQRHRPGVVFLDLGLPGMDGFAVAQVIRQQPDLNAVRVIALTGSTQPQYIERARAIGFDGYLVKPVDPSELRVWLEDEPSNSV